MHLNGQLWNLEVFDLHSTDLYRGGSQRRCLYAGRRTRTIACWIRRIFSGSDPGDQEEYFLRWLLSSLPLPSYMTPIMVVPMDKLLMNVSGKLDR